MNEVQAAIGRKQFKKLPEWLSKRGAMPGFCWSQNKTGKRKKLSEESLCFLVHPTLMESKMEAMCNMICEVIAGATSRTESRQGIKI